ncbi:MAG: EamA family transporter [Planctomycetota bacterium]
MSLFPVFLVICSAFMHAGWNLLARRQRSERIFFARMNIIIIVVGFLPFLISEVMTRSIPAAAWICVSGSGLCCGVYTFCLARSYELADFTVTYPVARALPVLLIGVGDVLLGKSLSVAGWAGLALVAAGCFFAPLHSFREIHFRRYISKASFWMVLTALCTVGYSMLDKKAAEVIVRTGPATAARYGYAFFFVAGMIYHTLLWLLGNNNLKGNKIGWKSPFWAACFLFGAYWLVLWAFQLSEQASYVVAFRQFSIIVGVVLAFLLYKERGLVVRLSGTVMITLGLVLIGIWG